MSDLPFTLTLTAWHGASRHVATFADVADLWRFYEVWRVDAEDAARRDARFRHSGRMIRSTSPPHDKAAALQWAAECVARDK